MEAALIPYFLSLTDQILIDVVFPRLNYQHINHLYQVHKRFNNICKSENMWLNKTTIDYLDDYKNKPGTITWKSYYQFLIKSILIPFYDKGSIVDYVKYHHKHPDMTLLFLDPLVDNDQTIAFVDQGIDLVAIKTYNTSFIMYKSLSLIAKIVFLDSNVEPTANEIYHSLISGYPNIYGIINNKGFTLFRSSEGDNAISGNGKLCKYYKHYQLQQFLEELGVDGPRYILNESTTDYFDKLILYPRWYLIDDFNINTIREFMTKSRHQKYISPEHFTHLQNWYNAVTEIHCHEIQIVLEKIGHIIYL